jgi:hypothetical protein
MMGMSGPSEAAETIIDGQRLSSFADAVIEVSFFSN